MNTRALPLVVALALLNAPSLRADGSAGARLAVEPASFDCSQVHLEPLLR